MGPDEKQLVLGIGTGRSGSESLAYLLNIQPDACFSHEFSLFAQSGERAARYRPPLAWHADEDEVVSTFEDLARYQGRVVGDIASYWLPHLPLLCERFPNLRVISIERDKASVVRSFLDKTPGRNHWTRDAGEPWRPDPLWDPVFPKYDIADKGEAIAAYWDDYKAETERLRSLFPGKIRVWPLESLNDETAVREVLEHAGISDEDIQFPSQSKRNQTKKKGLLSSLRKLLR